MQNKAKRARQTPRFFAVTSLGHGRWYWVVWPSLTQLQSGSAATHVAEGIEETKAAAVDCALAAAGIDGEWVAAKYAQSYYRTCRQTSHGAEPQTMLQSLTFVYRDLQQPITGEWLSVPHRIAKRTRKYVYVERQPYDATAQTGSWLDYATELLRLDRAMLEAEGYAFAPVSEVGDPLFFMTPHGERIPPDCLAQLGLSLPCTAADVRAAFRRLAKDVHPDYGGSPAEFQSLRAAYEQALRFCR